ncbi:MAG: GNAT family N-acetyltransferase [Solirubrobacteraceae bacterium]
MAYPERIDGGGAVYERWSFERHAPGFAELCADPEVMRFLGGPQSPAAAQETARRIEDHWTTFGFGLWAVMNGDACVGFTGACHPGPAWDPDFSGEVEVGWRLARAAWGRGLAVAGARAAVDAVAAEEPLLRVIAFVDPRNTRSLAVTVRLGMRRLRSAVDCRLGTTVDVFERPLEVPAR